MSRKRILISPNSFKECADSVTIAELIKYYLSDLKDSELIVRPISDGGDGFLNVCRFYFEGEIRKYKISTAFDDSRFECPVLYCSKNQEIYIESAEVLGLKVVPMHLRNPLKLSSKGLGELLLKITEEVEQGKINVTKVFLGIGGTATIDMGMGMMSKLGLIIYDSSNKILNVIPENFTIVSRIEYKPMIFPFKIIPILDVKNSLLGNDSGIVVFGEQKGANEDMILQLIKGFDNLLNLFRNNKLTVNTESLSGAGGGTPAALQIFFSSDILQSENLLNRNFCFSKFAGKIDYLITGEGAYDKQSGFGKGANILVNLFERNVRKIFLICGRIDNYTMRELSRNVYPIQLQDFFKNSDESIANYNLGLKLACERIKSEINF